ncbi:unnamed protein product [Blepharisma stoltei]|uniref:Uncharacterized protein n=1 Tax=Blepharisma stoltei TaxID=1481888 RepID=A0AAU9KC10_9CILI|nr:unnamed protein product [Blepharisma stoltei]
MQSPPSAAASRPHTGLSANDRAKLKSASSVPNFQLANVYQNQEDPAIIPTGEDWCALNNPNLPPVSEMEHMVDQCLCHLCNCGKHLCPGEYRRMLKSTSSQFSTTYKLKYPKYPPQPPSTARDLSYRHTNFHIDATSMYKKDFQAFPLEPKKAKEVKTPDSFKLKFASRSSYQQDFQGYGEYRAQRAAVSSLPFRGDELKLQAVSNYAKEFRKYDQSLYENKGKPPNPNFWKGSGVLSPVTVQMHETTSRKDFRPFTKDHMPKRDHGIVDDFQARVSWNGQFTTNYRENYTGQMNERYQRKKSARNMAN